MDAQPRTATRTAPLTAAPDRARRAFRGPGPGSIALIVFLAAAYFIPRGALWNADSHLFLTASIVDRGTLNIDPFAAFTGDLAQHGAHFYSDKAPGLSFLAVPIYLPLKYTLLGGHPYASLFSVPADQRIDFLPRYLIALVLAALPTALLSALIYRFLERLGVARRWRTLLALTYGLGTIALPFGTVLFSHQLAALLLFGAFLLLFRVRRGEGAAWLSVVAGLLAGYAVITEYPTAIIALALLAYALISPADPAAGRRRAALVPAAWMAAGMVPPALLGALYNTLAFGGPFSLGYSNLAAGSQFRAGQALGFLGVTYPHLDAIWQTTFGPYRGLFLLSPVLLLAIPGFVVLFHRREWRAEAVLWLATVLAYFTFVVSYFEWDGGFSLGPRHFLPALPFLVLPIGVLFGPARARAWKVIASVLAAISIGTIVLATATGPLVDPRFTSPLTQWVLPSLAGLTPDPAHPDALARALPGALLRAAPFFTHAQLQNNWGMVFHLPGALQLVPLAAAVALVCAWRWWQAWRVAAGDARTVMAESLARPASATAVARMGAPLASAAPGTGGSALGSPVPGTAFATGAPDGTTPSDPDGLGEPDAGPQNGGIPVRQMAGSLADRLVLPWRDTGAPTTAPDGSPAWQRQILAMAASAAEGAEPPPAVVHALTVVRLALARARDLNVFRRVRTVILYGPLAEGADPFREVDLLVVCEPLRGTGAMERAFAELDTLGDRMRDQTGVQLRFLLVVPGQSERMVPGEPSWRQLIARGMVIYGEPIAP